MIDGIVDWVPEPMRTVLSWLKWAIVPAAALLLLWFCLPLLPYAVGLLRRVLTLLAGFRGLLGWLGRLAAWCLKKLPESSDYGPSAGGQLLARGPDQLRIGLLGARRAGKSTFIVMLTKHLKYLVEGASLDPHTEVPDNRELAKIAAEVSQCLPTQEEKQVALDLHWPFRWSGEPTGEGGGKLAKQLVLKDFPGEWAAGDASAENRGKLTAFLRSVDGLFVVIDPTELEVEDGHDRWKLQEAAIDSMFRADGVDLGGKFKRALGVIITKRDAITPDLIRKIAKQQDGTIGTDVDVEAICRLASSRTLAEAETERLGRLLLQLLFPGKLRWLHTRLDSEVRDAQAKGFWGRLGLRRSSAPQCAVFAVSQLGFDLGRQVVEHRACVRQWERDGGAKPKPTINLDLDRVNKAELDLHRPFTWIFNAIPAGWLHEANARSGMAATILRRRARRRFAGSPVVQQDSRVSLRRIGVWALMAVAAGLGLQWAGQSAVKSSEENQVVALFEQAATGEWQDDQLRGQLRGELERCRGLSTRPLIAQLNDFESLLNSADHMAEPVKVLEASTTEWTARIEAGLKWFRNWESLLPEDAIWKEPLKGYRRKLATPLPHVLEQTVQAVNGQANELAAKGAFSEALACIAGVERTLVGGNDKEPAIARALRDLQTLDLEVHHRDQLTAFEKLKGEINLLLLARPPRHGDALVKLDAFVTKELHPALADEARKLKADVIDKFHAFTDTGFRDAMDRDDVAEATRLLKEFLSATPPNPYTKKVEELRDQAYEMRVANAIQKARGMLDNGKPAEAWTQLERVRLDLPKAKPATQNEWLKRAADIKYQLKAWREAIELLRNEQLRGESWVRTEAEKNWQKWTEELKTTVITLRDQGKGDEALQACGLYLNTAAGDPVCACPPPLRKQIEEEIQKLPAIVFAQEVDKAEKTTAEALKTPQAELSEKQAKELEAALDLLLGLRDKAKGVTDRAPLERWVNLVVAVHEKLGHYPAAAEFLTSLQRAPIKALPPPTEARLAEVWQHYFQYVRQRFLDGLTADEAGAWKTLREVRREPNSEVFQELLEQFATEQLDAALRRLRTKTEELCDNARFDDALKEVEGTQTVLEPWFDVPGLKVDERLTALGKEIRAKRIGIELAKVLSRLGRDDPKTLHEEIRKLRGEPDLSSAQLGELSNAEADNLIVWERQAYEGLREVANVDNLSVLHERLGEYTDPTCPFAERRSPQRRQAVETLKRWLEQFDAIKEYKLQAIDVTEFPPNSILAPNWNAKLRFQVLRANGAADKIFAETDDTPVAFRANLEGHNRFNWKKGDQLELAIWHDYPENAKYFIGALKIDDPYALPQMAAAARLISTEGTAWPNTGVEKTKVKIVVPNLEPLPLLPVYEK